MGAKRRRRNQNNFLFCRVSAGRAGRSASPSGGVARQDGLETKALRQASSLARSCSLNFLGVRNKKKHLSSNTKNFCKVVAKTSPLLLSLPRLRRKRLRFFVGCLKKPCLLSADRLSFSPVGSLLPAQDGSASRRPSPRPRTKIKN